MKILEFSVNDQKLSMIGNDFNAVRGSKGNLLCKFEINDKRDGSVIAVFDRNKEEHAVKLDDDFSCLIPNEIVDYPCFNVKLVFIRNGNIIPTNKLLIRMEG